MLLRGTAIVSVLTLLSRCLGFVRDLLVAQLLGATLFADAFFVAFRIPNLLRSIAAEGALTSAFVPVFSTALARGKDHAVEACKRAITFVLCLTLPLTIVGTLFAEEVVDLIAPGFSSDPEKLALATSLTQMMLPYIICVSIIAIINSALNSLKVFGASAWAQVIMNIVLIAGALCALPFDQKTATTILAISVIIGGIAQVVAQIPACRRASISLRPSRALFSPEVREIVRLMLPATVGASVYQVTIFLGTLLASLLAEGSISWLFYADRIAQFPIGIFSIALASVLLPTLASAQATADTHAFRGALGDSLRFTSFVMLPLSAGIWALAEPITQLLFERGEFSHHSTVMTAEAIKVLAFGLWSASCYSMIARAFIARKDTVTPTLIGLISLVVYTASAITLMGPIPRNAGRIVDLLFTAQTALTSLLPTTQHLGHIGIALASSIASLASLTLASAIFSTRYKTLPWRAFTKATIVSGVSSVVMVLGIRIAVGSLTSPLSTLIVGIPAGALIYSVAAFALRSSEMRDCLALTKKLRRFTTHP